MSLFLSSRHATSNVQMDDKYARLVHSKMKVLKCGRRGQPREIHLALTSNMKELVWASNSIGPKFGKSNKGKGA